MFTEANNHRMTTARAAAERLAVIGQDLDISRKDALAAVERVADHLELNENDLHLLRIFAALTKPQDWRADSRPIAWPTNDQLLNVTGFTRAALNRHVTALIGAGLLSIKESASGERWGVRDSNGNIVEAYGFDLSPLAARTADLEWIAEGLDYERALQEDDAELMQGIVQGFMSGNGSPFAFLRQGSCRAAYDAFKAQLEGLGFGSPEPELGATHTVAASPSFFGFWTNAPLIASDATDMGSHVDHQPGNLVPPALSQGQDQAEIPQPHISDHQARMAFGLEEPEPARTRHQSHRALTQTKLPSIVPAPRILNRRMHALKLVSSK